MSCLRRFPQTMDDFIVHCSFSVKTVTRTEPHCVHSMWQEDQTALMPVNVHLRDQHNQWGAPTFMWRSSGGPRRSLNRAQLVACLGFGFLVWVFFFFLVKLIIKKKVEHCIDVSVLYSVLSGSTRSPPRFEDAQIFSAALLQLHQVSRPSETPLLLQWRLTSGASVNHHT